MPSSDFSSVSSDSGDQFPGNTKQLANINVLKYLPEARKILQGHQYQKFITKCKYNEQLLNTPNIIIPTNNKALSSKPLLPPKLIKLQQATHEHNTMKQKIKGLLQKNQGQTVEKKLTLWSVYGNREPVYARFGLKAKKNNFANNMMVVNDVNIDLGQKFRIEKTMKSFKEDRNWQNPGTIRFQSHFQSGNLLYAYRHQSPQIETYDLLLHNDINTKGHNQWFFFRAINTKKYNRIKFNIINLTKEQSMFTYGIKPLTFSQKQYNCHNIGWCRNGQKINYTKNKIRRESNLSKYYYTLSFQYYFHEADTVYFAPTYPYTYSQLLNYCDNLMGTHVYNNMVCIKPVVETFGSNRINVVTISCGKKEIEESKVVWVIARQHPGQTTGSFMAQGIINYLLQYYQKNYSTQSKKTDKKQKTSPLDSLIFKIVPMVNVDGVVHGNTRSNLAGVDPNRMWKKSVKKLCPEISALKKLILSHKDNVQMILDLHSHSKKLGCFFYSNTIRHNPQATKIYPALVCQADQKQRFNLKNCRFRGGYQTTARNILFNQLQNQKVYTVECSMLGYMKNNRIVEYTISDYFEMGQLLIETFIKLYTENSKKQQEKALSELEKIVFNDGESARSQSSLSEDQYEEILFKNKKKTTKKPKTINKLKNNSIYGIKEELKDKKNLQKIETKINFNSRGLSAGNFKSPRTALISQKNPQYLLSKENNPSKKEDARKTKTNNILGESTNTSEQKSLPIKIPKILSINSSLARSKNKKNTHNQNDSSLSHSKDNHNKLHTSMRNRTKTVDHKFKKSMTKLSIIQQQNKKINACVQVEVKELLIDQTFTETRNYFSEKSKSRLKSLADEERQLCVIGSSLEQGCIEVYKNQVGAQITPQILSLCGTSAMKKVDLNSAKKSNKIPKILSYLTPSPQTQQNNFIGTNPRKLVPITLKRR